MWSKTRRWGKGVRIFSPRSFFPLYLTLIINDVRACIMCMCVCVLVCLSGGLFLAYKIDSKTLETNRTLIFSGQKHRVRFGLCNNTRFLSGLGFSTLFRQRSARWVAVSGEKGQPGCCAYSCVPVCNCAERYARPSRNSPSDFSNFARSVRTGLYVELSRLFDAADL